MLWSYKNQLHFTCSKHFCVNNNIKMIVKGTYYFLHLFLLNFEVSKKNYSFPYKFFAHFCKAGCGLVQCTILVFICVMRNNPIKKHYLIVFSSQSWLLTIAFCRTFENSNFTIFIKKCMTNSKLYFILFWDSGYFPEWQAMKVDKMPI